MEKESKTTLLHIYLEKGNLKYDCPDIENCIFKTGLYIFQELMNKNTEPIGLFTSILTCLCALEKSGSLKEDIINIVNDHIPEMQELFDKQLLTNTKKLS